MHDEAAMPVKSHAQSCVALSCDILWIQWRQVLSAKALTPPPPEKKIDATVHLGAPVVFCHFYGHQQCTRCVSVWLLRFVLISFVYERQTWLLLTVPVSWCRLILAFTPFAACCLFLSLFLELRVQNLPAFKTQGSDRVTWILYCGVLTDSITAGLIHWVKKEKGLEMAVRKARHKRSLSGSFQSQHGKP